jgi:hypothetical protein
MRITKELLHKFAQETVKNRKRTEPDLHAAYLTGSLLQEEPLLGGTTDIDIVLVHKYKAPVERETEALTQDISLDIFHKVKDDYDQHRQLRRDPWLGYPLTHYNIILFDTDHWLEFIQATVNAEFQRTDNVLARVNDMLASARANWFSLIQTPSMSHLHWLNHYLSILALAANAAAGLVAPPLTTRRFMLNFEWQVSNLGSGGLYLGLKGLIGLSEDFKFSFPEWLPALEEDFDHLIETTEIPVHLGPCRKDYYLKAIQSLAESVQPEHAIWPLLRVWLDIKLAANQPQPAVSIWDGLLADLKLTEQDAGQRQEALDAYLDNIDILIENWAQRYGI